MCDKVLWQRREEDCWTSIFTGVQVDQAGDCWWSKIMYISSSFHTSIFFSPALITLCNYVLTMKNVNLSIYMPWRCAGGCGGTAVLIFNFGTGWIWMV